MDMWILPVLTYNSQIWALTRETVSKLQIFQRITGRRLFSIKFKDRMRNEVIPRTTNIKDLEAAVIFA
jgi:hypothetical protein